MHSNPIPRMEVALHGSCGGARPKEKNLHVNTGLYDELSVGISRLSFIGVRRADHITMSWRIQVTSALTSLTCRDRGRKCIRKKKDIKEKIKNNKTNHKDV